jgi:hypothetical protein
MEQKMEEQYNEIYENIYNKSPIVYNSFQINYYKDIYHFGLIIGKIFLKRKFNFSNENDKLLYDFFIRSLIVLIIEKEISNKPINILLSNYNCINKSIIVNTIEFKNDYCLVENQPRNRYIHDTKYGLLKFDVGYFKNYKLNSQIIFALNLANKLAKNNLTIKQILLDFMLINNGDNSKTIEYTEYVNTMEIIIIDDNYDLNAKEISCKIQTQYTMFQILVSNIISDILY